VASESYQVKAYSQLSIAQHLARWTWMILSSVHSTDRISANTKEVLAIHSSTATRTLLFASSK